MEFTVEKYKFWARPGFMVREISGENTLIPIDTDNIVLEDGRLPVFNGVIQLNGLGLMLWNSMQSPKSLEELIEIVCSEYDTNRISVEDLKQDILDFINIGVVNQIILLIEKEGNYNETGL